MAELLVEILSEEIPARMQAQAIADFERLVCAGLGEADLAFERVRRFVTPRRLALIIDGLPLAQPDRTEERRGPRADAPDAAIGGFLRSVGLERRDLEERDTGKGRFLFAVIRRQGRDAGEVIVEVLERAMRTLPWPKSMRWGDHDVRWVRPLQGLLCRFAGQTLPLCFGPVAAGGTTCGHRFLAPEAFAPADGADYLRTLAAANVMVDADARRQAIATQADRLAAGENLTVRADPALLDEVVGLAEWPVVMIGRIDLRFMDVPAEVLVTAMRAHQKYFSLVDGDGVLAPRFLLVANTPGVDGGRAIVAGNERVLRARLADAKFFWDQDRRQALASRVGRLAGRVFHARLGSDLDRVGRLARLARELAVAVGADPELAARAAELCKADLTTGMVGEFPELQGAMGRYYALHDGEDAAVADAIADHYAPQGPSDRCPAAPVSVAVALADKIDTLAGFFAIGETPTGSKDPYALRRAALGVIRVIIENRLRLALRPLLAGAVASYPDAVADGRPDAVAREVLAFIADRLKVHLRAHGVRHDLIAAVFALGGEDDLVRLLARVDALKDFLDTDDGANLLTAYRRASNIVRIEEKRDGASYDEEAEPALFAEENEALLHRSLMQARQRIAEALTGERFAAAMTALADLRRPIDTFFDSVTVNCADAQLRANRLKLLSQIRSALGGVAEFSLVEG
ncbi:MAG: glycine--tRNA ligase subunit beta [Rhodospirillales bacterium]|nr:glycine--tRNA ligase subunit beta [Rhodospirillales bacterium]